MSEETLGAGTAREGEAELRRMVASYEARLEEVADLAARIRHEINNPLTGLIGQAQLLLRDATLNDSARRRVQTIEQLAARIRDQVAELRVVQHANHAGADAAPTTLHTSEHTQTDDEQAGDPPRH
ncbi:MAG TPA: histidine kinase dimerization/phospho-acceptor domain-containing protein [Pyrinomonadaceae bacterium]|nr:histidine kinase dimerization/phospho-acceptor domain-containing protein [Pyrinomonadaceae bacterium]